MTLKVGCFFEVRGLSKVFFFLFFIEVPEEDPMTTERTSKDNCFGFDVSKKAFLPILVTSSVAIPFKIPQVISRAKPL